MLTKKQHELLIFINGRISDTGVSPSFDEMKEALKLRSKSGIHRLITALEERGFIRRAKTGDAKTGDAKTASNQAAPQSNTVGAESKITNGKVIEGKFGGTPRPVDASSGIDESKIADLPVLGRIAAGTPIEAIQHEVDRVATPAAFLGQGEHYILEVQGESMIEAGIHDGDYAIIQKGNTATNGEIVVALVDSEEATLKRLRKKGASVALEAANPAFETRIFGPDRVSVQGKLVGLMRKY